MQKIVALTDIKRSDVKEKNWRHLKNKNSKFWKSEIAKL